jgi:hypothetical protein
MYVVKKYQDNQITSRRKIGAVKTSNMVVCLSELRMEKQTQETGKFHEEKKITDQRR